MAINFNSINLEVIDITSSSSPDIFINPGGITFTKRVLEELNYPQNVQYCLDATNKVFAIRVCKATEAKAAPFSKQKSEQTTSFYNGNKTLRETITKLIPDYNEKKRYRITGEYDPENKVMYFDISTAKESDYHNSAKRDE